MIENAIQNKQKKMALAAAYSFRFHRLVSRVFSIWAKSYQKPLNNNNLLEKGYQFHLGISKGVKSTVFSKWKLSAFRRLKAK